MKKNQSFCSDVSYSLKNILYETVEITIIHKKLTKYIHFSNNYIISTQLACIITLVKNILLIFCNHCYKVRKFRRVSQM